MSIIEDNSEDLKGLIFSTIITSYQIYASSCSLSVSFEDFLNTLTASAKPLKSSGIFLPPKSKRITAAIISISVVPIERNIYYFDTSFLTGSSSFRVSLKLFLIFLISLRLSPAVLPSETNSLLPKIAIKITERIISSVGLIFFMKFNI